MASTIRRYEITDAEWEQKKPYIPEEQKASSRRRPSKDSRAMLNEICWILWKGLLGEFFLNGMAHGIPFISGL